MRYDATGPAIRRIIFGTSIKESHYVNRGRLEIKPEIAQMLAVPSWSVKSLLPPKDAQGDTKVSKQQLHHLLKLSALPLPKTEHEERKMLKTLEDQIHFVKDVQSVDTTGVEPLVTVRDETAEQIKESTITLETLQPYLDKEKKVGKNGTIRREKPAEMIRDSGWDPFELGDGKESRKKGKFFFVKKDKAIVPP